MLKHSSGITGERSRLGVQRILLAGMRGMSENVESSVAEEYAMATVIESAEGLMPSYEEVCKRSDWPKWEEAIQKELSMLKKSGTWKLTKRPPEANVVGCKWVFHIKKNTAREIEKYKAHLVAKGFTQIYGVDYYETYAPVARLSLFRLLLVITAQNNWPIDTFNFDSAYLNSMLGEEETIYMEQPPGYETGDHCFWVWRLHKMLYGLKQGARNWYEVLRKALLELEFE